MTNLHLFDDKLRKLLLMMSLLLSATVTIAENSVYHFTEADVVFLQRFSIKKLPAILPAVDNAIADNEQAALLGKRIFFDKRFSANGNVACAQCHQAKKYFTDGLPQAQGLGQVRRNAPSLFAAAYGPWKNWDGSKDSLWSQALGPLEDNNEQGMSRLDVAKLMVTFYQKDYELVFGPIAEAAAITTLRSPASAIGSAQAQHNWQQLSAQWQDKINRIFSNVGKLLMAYQRKIPLPAARFDDFIHALENDPSDIKTLKNILSSSEVSGMRLFVGQARCVSCHNGPLLTNFEFHNVGASEPDIKNIDLGRYTGITRLQADEFTCLSKWSDAKPEQCVEMNYLKKNGPELIGAFKTPSLRNVAMTAPYMQSGQFASLKEVLNHYNAPTPPYYDRKVHPSRPHFDIMPLALTEQQLEQLIAFLGALTSPIPAGDRWWPQ